MAVGSSVVVVVPVVDTAVGVDTADIAAVAVAGVVLVAVLGADMVGHLVYSFF